jgi:hypothetical protein
MHATFGNLPITESHKDILADMPAKPEAIHGVMPFQYFIEAIRQMDKGELRINGTTLECTSFSSPDQLLLKARGQEYLRSPDLVKEWSRPWPALFLRKYGPDTSSLGIDEVKLNTILRNSRHPYGGLFHFSIDKLGFGVGGAFTAQVEILAPLYISLFAQLAPAKLEILADVDTSISPETLFAKVWHGAYRADDAKVAVVEFGDAPIVKTSEVENRRLRTLVKSLEVPPSLGQAVVVLIFNGEEIDYFSPQVEARKVKMELPKEKSWTELISPGPEEGTDDICFVLMPMNSQMKRIFKDVFAPAATELGLVAEHSDMLASSTIVPEIIKKIHTAKVVLADITRHRPNVYYEIGLAHKVNPSKVIVIGQELFNDLPSDLQQQSIRYFQYDDDTDGLNNLREQLKKRIRYCLEQRSK